MRITLGLPRSHRARVAFAAGAALAVVVAVVAANQPGPTTPAAAPRSAAAVAVGAGPTTAAGPPGSVAAVPTPVPPPPSGLRVLHAAYTFRDESAHAHGAPATDAAAGILLDPDTGTILWERDPHTPRPPASTTKIVTALVALQNLAPDQGVDVTSDALTQAPDETRLGMEAGDRYTVTELLQAMMMVSANDAAMAIAVDTVGLDRYVRAMNEQAAALGLRDSHFDNPVGLDSPDEQASPYDLAVFGLAAYDSSDLLRGIVGTPDLDVPATDGHIAYHLHNIDRLLELYGGAARGIKPGYTGDAGYCLVMLAGREGHRLVGVLMDDPRLYASSRALLEWGFSQEGIAPLPTPTPTPSPSPHR